MVTWDLGFIIRQIKVLTLAPLLTSSMFLRLRSLLCKMGMKTSTSVVVRIM